MYCYSLVTFSRTKYSSTKRSVRQIQNDVSRIEFITNAKVMNMFTSAYAFSDRPQSPNKNASLSLTVTG